MSGAVHGVARSTARRATPEAAGVTRLVGEVSSDRRHRGTDFEDAEETERDDDHHENESDDEAGVAQLHAPANVLAADTAEHEHGDGEKPEKDEDAEGENE